MSSWIRTWVGTGLLMACVPLQALAGGGGGEYAPVINLGTHFYAGTTGKSLTGANGYFIDFQTVKRKDVLRWSAVAELGLSSGKASLGAATPSFTMYNAAFLFGLNAYIFTIGRFQPYVGGFGIASWNLLKLSSPPTGVDENTTGLGFGYELVSGVDVRLGSAEGNAIRLQGSYWATSAGLGGVSGLQLTGFRLQLGIVY